MAEGGGSQPTINVEPGERAEEEFRSDTDEPAIENEKLAIEDDSDGTIDTSLVEPCDLVPYIPSNQPLTSGPLQSMTQNLMAMFPTKDDDHEAKSSTAVSITGGNFKGAKVGEKKQEFNIGTRNTTHNYYHYTAPANQDQGRPRDQIGDDGWIALSGSIRMSKDNPLSKHSHVFLGERTNNIHGMLPQLLAIKLLPCDDKNIKEAITLTKLASHPNVVSMVHCDIYQQTPFMFIAMERCQTRTLLDLIMENQKYRIFDINLSKKYTKQIFEGVEFIHDNDVVHGDLKPGNILISLDGKYLKISDFGVSKEVTVGHSVTKQTLAGTDGFKAPETLIDGVISKHSDIFSLGAASHVVLSNGKHPFGDNPYLLNYHIIENKNLDLSQLLVPEAENLLRSMLHPNPKERPGVNQLLDHPMFSKSDTRSCGDQQTSEMNTGQDTNQEAGEVDRSTTEEIHAIDAPSTSTVDSNRDDDETNSGKSIEKSNLKMIAVEDARSCGDQQTSEMNTGQNTNQAAKKVDRSTTEEIHAIDAPTSTVDSNRDDDEINRRKSVEKSNLEMNAVEAPSTSTADSNRDDDKTNRRKSVKKSKLELMAAEEECQTLMEKTKFATALIKLNELVADGRNEMSTKLMIAECNLQLGDHGTAKNVVDDIRQDMMTSPLPTSDIKSLVKYYMENSFHIRAMLLSPILSKSFARNSTSFDAVVGIRGCTYDMAEIIKALVKSGGHLKVIANDFGIPYLIEMLKDFRGLNVDDIDRKKEYEAWCLNNIGFSYRALGKYNQAIEIETEGVKILEQHFHENTSKYQVHGILLHNIGLANHDLGKYDEAEKYYLRSIESKQKATDYANDDAKQKSIELTRKWLKITRDKMKK